MIPHRVALLALDHVVPLDLGTVVQVFGFADRRYAVRVCGVAGGTPVESHGGFRILPDYGIEELATAETIVIPGIFRGPALRGGRLAPEVAGALTAAAARGARLVSICTGAFVLAAAGLLDGRPATTHWGHAERFGRLFPAVRLDPTVLFVDDGDVLTSAGVTAGMDLCLHVVRRDHGSEVANRVARRCVVASWRDGGQAQFIERPLPEVGEATTAPTRAWALERLDHPLDLRMLAEHARMSVRTFTRRFRDETGQSPNRWLTRQRIERARHLLEATDLPVDRVAREAGFGTATAMRQHLHATLGVAPSTYRRAFRAPSPALAPAAESAATAG
jgi:transcriptional regulator GlxA family with amidase domain